MNVPIPRLAHTLCKLARWRLAGLDLARRQWAVERVDRGWWA